MEGSRFSILILSFTTSEAEIGASASGGLVMTFAVASPCRRRLNGLFHPQAALEAATHRVRIAYQVWSDKEGIGASSGVGGHRFGGASPALHWWDALFGAVARSFAGAQDDMCVVR